MALRNANMIKTVVGPGPLTLQAVPKTSLKVKKIFVESTSANFVTVKIDKTTVGYFRVSQVYGNHLFFPVNNAADGSMHHARIQNLLNSLYDAGIFSGYPVGEGQTFIIESTGGATDVKSVLYDEYDAGDIKPEDENGTNSKDYLYVNYGQTGSVIDAGGDFLYTKSLNPVEFPAFPFGADVPSKTRIELYGICGKEVGVRNATPATAIYTRFLKLVKEREVLFDTDRNGLIFDFSSVSGGAGIKIAGGRSIIGDLSSVDSRMPYMFPEPLIFDSGEELNIYVTVTEAIDGSSIPLDYQTIGLIMKVRRE